MLCFIPVPSRAQLCVTEMHCVSNKICVDGDGCGSIMIHRVDGMFGALDASLGRVRFVGADYFSSSKASPEFQESAVKKKKKLLGLLMAAGFL